MNTFHTFKSSKQLKKTIHKSLSKHIVEQQKKFQESIIAPENMLRYQHGKTWKNPALPDAEDGAMETISANFEIASQKIADGDLSLISESISHINREFERQIMQSMYALISRSCEKSGNSINAGETTLPQAFEEMLQKIEFSVGSDGKVSLPQLHSNSAQSWLEILDAQPPEYHQRIEALIETKSQKALEQEQLRKSKFKSRFP